MVDLLRRLEVGPEDARASVIWLHGLGASGHDFADVPRLLELPDVRFIFPHAPNRPVTINMGLIMPAWFDVRRLASDAFDRHAAAGAGDDAIDARAVRQSVEQVRALIEHERGRGVPAGSAVVESVVRRFRPIVLTAAARPSASCWAASARAAPSPCSPASATPSAWPASWS